MTRIGTTVEAEGMRELRKKLRRMDNGMDNLKGLHLDLAEIVADRAEALAPVRTGRLKQTIRAAGTQTAGRVRAGSPCWLGDTTQRRQRMAGRPHTPQPVLIRRPRRTPPPSI